MNDTTTYSIGHGRKKIEEFITELKKFHIQYLLDIRSKPFSKWSPQFNQAELKSSLNNVGIKYLFMGDTLGGLPSDRSCYNADGKIIYSIMKDKDFFKEGLNRLITANQKKAVIAIMCSESKPEECHRSKLIGEELLKNKISIRHILPGGAVEKQEAIINRLNKGRGNVDLFEEVELFSRNSY